MGRLGRFVCGVLLLAACSPEDPIPSLGDGDTGGSEDSGPPLPGGDDCGENWYAIDGPAIEALDLPGRITLAKEEISRGDWLKPDHLVQVQVAVPAGAVIEILNDRGELMEGATATTAAAGIVPLPQTLNLSFTPKASFQYRTPGSTDAHFQGTRYYLRVSETDAVAEGAQVQFHVEHLPGAGGG